MSSSISFHVQSFGVSTLIAMCAFSSRWWTAFYYCIVCLCITNTRWSQLHNSCFCPAEFNWVNVFHKLLS